MEIFLEIQKDSYYKIEANKVDRVITIPYPAYYGYIKDTIQPDGDDLDVFIVTKRKLFPGKIYSLEAFKPIGYYKCLDGGEEDDKYILLDTITQSEYSQPELAYQLAKIKAFLINYKKGFAVKSFVKGTHPSL